MNATQTSRGDGRSQPSRAVQILAALAVLILAGTYLAAQIDYLRRHTPGIPPTRYLLPQVTQIWLPGVGAAVALSIIALVLHRRNRKSTLQTGDQSVPSGRPADARTQDVQGTNE